MTGTTITVQGSFESFHPAERATVHVGVGFEGPDRESVVSGTTRATQALVAGIVDRHDPERGREEHQDRVGLDQVEDDRDDAERDEQIRPPRAAEEELAQVEGLRRRAHVAAG